jgi:hypothetical protein
VADSDSPLNLIPPPETIHQRMGRLLRELDLLRRLLRLSQATRDERTRAGRQAQEVSDVTR